MEDLVGSLENSLNVSLNEFSSDRQHPRFSQFKLKSNKSSQEERRKLTLEAQKKKRYDYQNHVRKLAESDFNKEDDDDLENNSEDMDWCPPKIKSPRAYRDQIMLSEWLVEVPDDFESNWIMVPSPMGKRCLIVASKGRTKVYAKSGYNITEFSSLLPGGSQQSASDSTILDCLWNERKQSYYVLDVLSWSKVPLLGCEAQFRFFWLQSKFADEPQLALKSKRNHYPFIRLPFTLCTTENIEQIMLETESSTWKPLDGLLFYHKLGFYTPKVSPLVGWLKPFMLPEVLNVRVPDIYLEKKPPSYENIHQHLKKTSQQKIDENTMETAINE